ncbi:VanZ family protein [Neobacillus massiliamazoniensis]|uniref:VanZ family protein n=1 Tax=Neobacillus massiliamazoniensis TaxID=1499688 RepID=A0A0U1NTB7_9BACI|nr:VanZ family protein [Neobacillus massiliamazoniensis]CRK81300.1 VanZ family protein [Neobacillus massiliamazoniensis]
MKSRWFWWALVLLWCIQIFYFTALPVYNDEHTRGFLTRFFTHAFPSIHTVIIDVIDYYIRKLAHITVFGILALLFKTAISNKPRPYIYAWIFTTLYAGTDEWHQMYVPGRTASIIDVLIDSTGAFIFLICMFLWKKNKQKALSPS